MRIGHWISSLFHRGTVTTPRTTPAPSNSTPAPTPTPTTPRPVDTFEPSAPMRVSLGQVTGYSPAERQKLDRATTLMANVLNSREFRDAVLSAEFAGKPGFASDTRSPQEVYATIRAAKNGSKYIQATFCDKTGTVPVRQWDANDTTFGEYRVGGYIKVRGRVELYKNAMQMIAFSVQNADGEKIDPADFLPMSSRPLDEMERE